MSQNEGYMAWFNSWGVQLCIRITALEKCGVRLQGFNKSSMWWMALIPSES